MTSTKLSSEGYVWREGQPLQSGIETESDEYDVIVIGAGFAGLTAARDLSSHAKVLLLEARDRIGGRTWVGKVDGQEFEMGGMWVHWYQPYIWTEITKYGLQGSLVLASGTSSPETVYFNDHGKLETITDLDAAACRIDRLMTEFFSPDGLTLKDIVPRPYDIWQNYELINKYDTMTSTERMDQMDLTPTERNVLETAIANLGLVTADKVGFAEAAQWHALCGTTMELINDTMGKFKLGHGGTTSLALAMMSDYTGDRLFNSPVASISESAGDGVTVTCTSGRAFKAKHVICTIPLNVVADIKFEPPLSPLRQQAVHVGHPGRGGKIHYIVSPPLAPFTSSSTAPTDLTFLFTDHNNSTNDTGYLISFVHSNSPNLDDLSDSETVKQAFAAMHPAGSSQVKSYVYHDWRKDPYTRGTWCCFEAGYTSKYLRELQAKHGERVWMASSDWAQGWRGCFDGAIEQGALAARAVKSALKEMKDKNSSS